MPPGCIRLTREYSVSAQNSLVHRLDTENLRRSCDNIYATIRCQRTYNNTSTYIVCVSIIPKFLVRTGTLEACIIIGQWLGTGPIVPTSGSPHEVWYCVINFVFPKVLLYASYVHVASLILLPPSKMASLARTRLTGRLVSIYAHRRPRHWLTSNHHVLRSALQHSVRTSAASSSLQTPLSYVTSPPTCPSPSQ